jgi:putative ABC transport system ATP-binding protein
MEYLDRMGLKDWAQHLPNELSGGQKQRIAIARALIAKPKVILADEPTGALDSVTSQEVMNILTDINVNENITMLIVTHELDIAKRTQKTIRITDGMITETIMN